jgi:uncharacterized protein (DUF2141 family)
MKEFIHQKPAAAITVMSPEKGVLMRVRWILCFAVLMFANVPAVAFAQSSSCPVIHVKIQNIRNSTGNVACALFDSPAGFPTEFLRYATNIIAIKIRDTEARCDFLDVPPGTYALAVSHDENMDGRINNNWMGIPTEGYGFSNNAKALLGPPSFSAAGFPYHGGILELTITLHY